MKYALYLLQPLSEVSPSGLSVPACVSGVTGALLLLLAACITTQGLWDSLPCSRSPGLQALLPLGERRLGNCEVHGCC